MHPRGARAPQLVPRSGEVLAKSLHARCGNRAYQLPRVFFELLGLGPGAHLRATVLPAPPPPPPPLCRRVAYSSFFIFAVTLGERTPPPGRERETIYNRPYFVESGGALRPTVCCLFFVIFFFSAGCLLAWSDVKPFWQIDDQERHVGIVEDGGCRICTNTVHSGKHSGVKWGFDSVIRAYLHVFCVFRRFGSICIKKFQ